ncbi:hypothetical protein [Pseudomonas phage PIP]|nr:hypothetical protein [Pseudomonas phage PIP]
MGRLAIASHWDEALFVIELSDWVYFPFHGLVVPCIGFKIYNTTALITMGIVISDESDYTQHR